MRLGAHQSIAGGLHRAVEAAQEDGCEALQIFSRNQNQWKAKPLDPEEVERFRSAVAEWGVPRERLLVHDSYLINVCARDRALRRKSLDALIEELERCATLGIPSLVMHPGSHMGQGEAKGIALVAESVSRALDATAEGRRPPRVLLEGTAGQGTNLGYRLEHLRDLLAAIEPTSRVGICLDTQHLFAAGYDLTTPEAYAATLETMDRLFGLARIEAFHLNDSKRERGSRVDRHAKIGEGLIGRSCFRSLLDDRRWAECPGILELPRPYPPQLTRLRRLADGTATHRRRPARKK